MSRSSSGQESAVAFQRVEELLLLLAIEIEILTRRGKGAPASLDLDPIREVCNR